MIDFKSRKFKAAYIDVGMTFAPGRDTMTVKVHVF